MNDNSTGETLMSNSQRKKLAAQEHNKKLQDRLATEVVEVLTTEQKEELEALSKEVFNSTSRYATLIRDGEVAPVTYTTTEYVPDEAGGEGITREVNLVEYYPNTKSAKLQVKRHNYASVKALMLQLKDQQDRMKALIAKLEADKRAELAKAQLTKQVTDNLTGSAV